MSTPTCECSHTMYAHVLTEAEIRATYDGHPDGMTWPCTMSDCWCATYRRAAVDREAESA